MFKKFKLIIENDGVFFIILLLLVAIASFGLGRMSLSENISTVTQATNEGSISLPDTQKASINTADSVGVEKESVSTTIETGQYVASKNGSKYHLPWCSGAKRMKEENKIWFGSKEEAEGAGYAPAKNCKGI